MAGRLWPPLPLLTHPSLPHRGCGAQHLLLPSSRLRPHSLLSPLDSSSSGCRSGQRDSAFVPWGGRCVRGQGAGNATELGIWEKGGSLQAAQLAAEVAVAAAGAAAAAVEIVPALCRPHLSYLIHHYRIPPNRRAPQHLTTYSGCGSP